MAHGKHRRKYSRVIGDQFHEFTTLRFRLRSRCKNQIRAIYHRSREKKICNIIAQKRLEVSISYVILCLARERSKKFARNL